MPTRIVTISHVSGGLGDSVGRAVADRLGFRHVNEDVITMAAQRHGLDEATVADAERRRSLLERIAEDFSGPVMDPTGGMLIQDVEAFARRDDVRQLIVHAIRDLADQGQVVIVAHAAAIPLADRKDVLRVMVTASDEVRTARLAEGYGGDKTAAAKFLKQSDAGRADYFQRFYKIRQETPIHYDVVLNTDTLDVDETADIIVAAARRRK